MAWLTIISGGQVVWDRAALDVAIDYRVPLRRLVPEEREGCGSRRCSA
jgi:hypothetical protein